MNRLPETVNSKFNELFAAIGLAGDDLKLAGAEAAMVGNFSLVSTSMENCQRLMALEMDIKTYLNNYESQHKDQTVEKSFYKRARRRTRKSGGGLRVRVAGKVIEEGTIAETFVETLKVFGLDKVARLNKVITSIPLIARQQATGYQAQKQCNGWYITTHVNKSSAKILLEEIAKALNIEVKIECIER